MFGVWLFSTALNLSFRPHTHAATLLMDFDADVKNLIYVSLKTRIGAQARAMIAKPSSR